MTLLRRSYFYTEIKTPERKEQSRQTEKDSWQICLKETHTKKNIVDGVSRRKGDHHGGKG